MMTTILPYEAALLYLQRGWQPIPLPPRAKGPTTEGWQQLRLSADKLERYFPPRASSAEVGVGVLLGAPSGNLIDVDLDWKRTGPIARILLPRTGAIFGHAGKPASHYLYRVTDDRFERPGLRRVQHLAPPQAAVLAAEGREEILEVRGAGHQTVFPPSLHESGVAIVWNGYNWDQLRAGDMPCPATLDSRTLLRACASVAAAALLASYWRNGQRNHMDLCLAGALLHAGWTPEETIQFIHAVAFGAGDTAEATLRKTEQRVAFTARKLAAGEHCIGWPSLREVIDDEQIERKLSAWLPMPEQGPDPATGGISSPKPAGPTPREAHQPEGPADAPEPPHLLRLRPLILGMMDTLEEPLPPAGLIGVPTGLVDLDRHLGGLRPGELIAVAGRPGAGKSALGLTIMQHAIVQARLRTLYVSLEMNAHDLALRLLSAESGVPLRALRERALAEADWRQLLPAAQRLCAGTDAAEPELRRDHIIADISTYTTKQLRSEALRLHKEEPLRLIIVDYLQLMRPSQKGDNREQQVAQLSRDLKGLARELELPVVMLAQLNREAEHRGDHRPQLYDLRESGAVEQDCDIVMMLYREDLYTPGLPADQKPVTELLIRKNRNGPTGMVLLYFLAEVTRFVSAARPDDILPPVYEQEEF